MSDEEDLHLRKEAINSKKAAKLTDTIHQNNPSEIRAQESIRHYKRYRKATNKYIKQRIRYLRRCMASKYFFWTDAYQTRHPSHPKPKIDNSLESKVN
jgi:hypothetical protein